MLKKSWEGIARGVPYSGIVLDSKLHLDNVSIRSMLDELFNGDWRGKKVRITIEEIPEEET